MVQEIDIQQPLDLQLSLTMGQAFRWYELPPDFYGDGHKWFSGVLSGNPIRIRQTENGVEYRVGGPDGERPADDKDDELLLRYFREDDDIAAIYADISNRDNHIAGLVRKYSGMRVLPSAQQTIASRASVDAWKRCPANLGDRSLWTTTLGQLFRRLGGWPERLMPGCAS